MPSFIVGNPVASGPQIFLSGNFWSGRLAPVGGILVALDIAASGAVYIGLSGGTTLNSGGMLLSGGGNLDGVQLNPGKERFIPRLGLNPSGSIGLYFRHDVACSGQGRVFWEAW